MFVSIVEWVSLIKLHWSEKWDPASKLCVSHTFSPVELKYENIFWSLKRTIFGERGDIFLYKHETAIENKYSMSAQMHQNQVKRT